MKSRKINFKVFFLVVFFTFSASFVAAQSGPFVADVNIVSVTQKPTALEIVASHVNPVGFQNTKFIIPETNTKQNVLLAMLLTAMTTDKSIRMTFMIWPEEVVSIQLNN